MDKSIVTVLGGLLIILIYWFFFGKKDDAVEIGNKVKIKVEGGYKPSIVKIKKGEEVTIEFIRTDENSCLEEVIFPDFKIKEYLPLNTSVFVKLNPQNSGEYNFHCGMNMYSGKVIVS